MINKIKNYNKGAAWVGVFITLIFLTTIGLIITQNAVSSLRTAKREEQLIIAQSLAEAGIEKAIWKLNKGDSYTGNPTNDLITLPTGQIEVEIEDEDTDTKIVTATGYVPRYNGFQRKRKIKVKLEADFNKAGLGFRYGVQVGSLGMAMDNNATVVGNVYSSGNITGGNNNSRIKGDVFVSGAAGKIEDIIVGENNANPALRYGNAWSHIIKDSDVWGDATVRNAGNLQNTDVYGDTSYAAPPPEEPLPITEANLSTWEGWAAAGNNGNALGDTIINGISSLGPVKIDGNLTVNGQLRMTGTIWVTGNIIFNTGSYIYLDPAFGNDSSMIIADRPLDRNNYGKITVNNGVRICGSYALSNWAACDAGTVPAGNKSYIMILSTKNATTVANPAIYAGNNSKAVVYYTTQGMLEVRNNGALRAMTGGGIHIGENATVEYDIGLINANFSAGPGGSWVVKEWQVVYDN